MNDLYFIRLSLSFTHPWFMSCSVSSSHMRTWMASPFLIHWKMSSMVWPLEVSQLRLSLCTRKLLRQWSCALLHSQQTLRPCVVSLPLWLKRAAAAYAEKLASFCWTAMRYRTDRLTGRVSTVLAFLEGPVLRSFSPKRLRTGPGPVLKFTIKLIG